MPETSPAGRFRWEIFTGQYPPVTWPVKYTAPFVLLLKTVTVTFSLGTDAVFDTPRTPREVNTFTVSAAVQATPLLWRVNVSTRPVPVTWVALVTAIEWLVWVASTAWVVPGVNFHPVKYSPAGVVKDSLRPELPSTPLTGSADHGRPNPVFGLGWAGLGPPEGAMIFGLWA